MKNPDMSKKVALPGLLLLVLTVVAISCSKSPGDNSSNDSEGAAGMPDSGPQRHQSEPLFVTADSEDPLFDKPYIEVEEWREELADSPPIFASLARPDADPPPVKARHLYIHGGFTGTDARFTFIFPPKEQYDGRFYQWTYPLASEVPEPSRVVMGFAYGAATVQTNQGGASARPDTTEEAAAGGVDGTIPGYRANAAAAKYAREVAQRIYGSHRTYGYIYGSSGGGIQSLNAAENTRGVWDGFVPSVAPAPTGVPSSLTARVHTMRVLKDKWPQVIDAFEPGGGDPYAGLNEEERQALEEATHYGFPPRAWFNYVPRGAGSLLIVAASVPGLDPTYQEDFWTEPGYLGHDAAAGTQVSRITEARIQHPATVARVIEGPPRQLELSSVPEGDWYGSDVIITSGAGKGGSATLGSIEENIISFGPFANQEVVKAFQAGDEVAIDNSRYLALQTYHRHQIPPPGSEYDYPEVYKYWRHPDGRPKYPQREILVGPATMIASQGVTNNGRFNGKMIFVQTLLDGDAIAWQADWYRRRAEKLLGTEHVEENFRVWFFDHVQHGEPRSQREQTHVVSRDALLERALHDVSMWAEKGVAPAANTEYKVVDGLVRVPPEAAERKGIQPVVDLKANGGVRADVAVGETVTFTARVEVPPGTGSVVGAEWDFQGTGEYAVPETLSDAVAENVKLTATHTFSKPGTYFPALRATSHRQGDADTLYGRVQNLGRVRVVVRE